ncbi:MAG: Crp/Fnr family transcriptional regulator [Candidatus Peribacteria bacterium]|nr:MAG: Crp/Fnr family transcriptional regulator [Candidatus Peribacteria bacterium]
MKEIKNILVSLPHESVELSRGELVYHGTINHLYLLTSGVLLAGKRIHQGDACKRLVSLFAVGDMLGVAGLINQTQREVPFFAEVVSSEATVLKVSYATIQQQILRGDFQLTEAILLQLGSYTERTHSLWLDLLTLSAEQRAVSRLLQLAEDGRFSSKVGLAREVRGFKFSHEDIASICGTTRQTITIVLGELQAKGLLDYGRNFIRIHDIALLQAMLPI